MRILTPLWPPFTCAWPTTYHSRETAVVGLVRGPLPLVHNPAVVLPGDMLGEEAVLHLLPSDGEEAPWTPCTT